VPTDIILGEIDNLLANKELIRAIDVFTITASGEPTLHTGIGRIIRHIKVRTDKPVAILTNGSQLYLPEVRDDLSTADIVIPSLDGARPESFRKVNRPAKCSADLETIIKGLAEFSHNFSGEIWLEVLLVENINDAPEDIAALRSAIERIRPTRVQLNTVARPPFEVFARPLSRKRMEEVKKEIEKGYDGPVDILAGIKETEVIDKGKGRNGSVGKFSPEKCEEQIREMVLRRPCTAMDISSTLNMETEQVGRILTAMESRGSVTVKIHGGKKYYMVPIKKKTENE
jgi:wyosine [tRNA(Phe)-imidazoG37] synthetase (radical SAM superfamily)